MEIQITKTEREEYDRVFHVLNNGHISHDDRTTLIKMYYKIIRLNKEYLNK